MRTNFGAKPYLYPQPVLIIGTYNAKGEANAMNAAWGGVSEDHELTLCLSEDHQTTANLLKTKAVTVSIGTAKTVKECDYFGDVSGNQVPDKLARVHFHAHKAEHVNAPYFEELPLTLECEVVSYDPESCHLTLDIVNVSADESILSQGKIDPEKLEPITYDPVNHTYRKLGVLVGQAFHDGLIFAKK
jgi:flavin reductase (DIM6/NTAB) family NADH-FMN oxidoreductase RutF